ncbi:MAG: CPBP family intramembrane metalloprotease [Prevotellaceae bacterium]|nr:CPBP family intramembrane metalloprotease [Prevotellaceae bacterium]
MQNLFLKNSFANSGLGVKLVLLLFVALFCTLLAGSAVAVAGQFNLIAMSGNNYLLAVQSISAFFIFLLPAFIVAYLCSDNTGEFLFLNKRSNFFEIVAVIVILAVGTPFINLLTFLNELLAQIPFFDNLFTAAEERQRALAEQMIGANFWGAIAVIGLLAAVAEELMFRGAVLRLLAAKMNVNVAVWLSAAIFSLIHLQFFGFVPRMVLGAYLAYIAFCSKNIRLSVWAHFFNNAMFIIVYYFYKNETENIFSYTQNSGIGMWIAGIASGVLAVAGTVYLTKYWKSAVVSG